MQSKGSLPKRAMNLSAPYSQPEQQGFHAFRFLMASVFAAAVIVILPRSNGLTRAVWTFPIKLLLFFIVFIMLFLYTLINEHPWEVVDMNKLKVYLDTSVISHLSQADVPEKMADTRQLWEMFRMGKYEVCLSTVTLEELEDCPEPKRSRLFRYLEQIDYVLI